MTATTIVTTFLPFVAATASMSADTTCDVQGPHGLAPSVRRDADSEGVSFECEEKHMANCHLRIYYGPEGDTELKSVSEQVATSRRGFQQTVTIPLKDVLETLADAVYQNRGWIQDFADDEISISTDLFEVILAYQHYHRPSA